MYKLFINNKIVFLCKNPALVDNLIKEDFIIEPYTTKKQLDVLFSIIMNDDNNHNVVLFYKDVEFLLNELLTYFTCVEAAGGVVKNKDNEILLIHRRGYWDLPKGKIETGETKEIAAVREVEEETGLKDVHIKNALTFSKLDNKATYHSYFIRDTLCMKVSYWYWMETTYAEKLIPQTEEDIEIVKWVPVDEIPNYFNNMYTTIVDILKEIK